MKLGNTSYKKWLEEIKRKIKPAQLRVAVSTNAQLIELYWQLVPQAVAQIPWGHNRLIINKIKDVEKAFFYFRATVENDWRRDNFQSGIIQKEIQ